MPIKNTFQIADKRAKEIIRMQAYEEFKAANFRNLYQQVADLMYPCENQITSKKTPGEDKSLDIRDPTAMLALNKATAGFIAAWIPKDREFFGIHVKNRTIAEIDRVKRWCAKAVQVAHEEIFESNFMQQLQQTIKALLGFGTGCLFSEWDKKTLGLNYKDWHISTYTIKQNSKGQVDTNILKYELTARQASEEFKEPGEQVLKDAEETENESKLHTFIHIVRPRIERNVQFVDNLNMPFESVFVNVKEQIVVEEGGFEEFPYAVPRWEKSSTEKLGRGLGTQALSAVKELQQMRKDFTENANRWNKPTLEVVANNVEGEINISPGAINYVTEKDSIKGLQNQVAGNFTITKEMLEFQQNFIKNDCFYNDVFSQFRSLRGDRRVTLELELRNEEGLDQLVAPVINVESELFTPLLTRSILILIRNGRIPYPPHELGGQPFGIVYKGKLAMSMKQYQARGFMQFTQVLTALDPVFPEAKDTINADRALPDIAMALGVKAEHLSTQEEIAAKRQVRQMELMQAKAAAMAQVAAEGISKTSKKPEEGSPAERVLAEVGV